MDQAVEKVRQLPEADQEALADARAGRANKLDLNER